MMFPACTVEKGSSHGEDDCAANIRAPHPQDPLNSFNPAAEKDAPGASSIHSVPSNPRSWRDYRSVFQAPVSAALAAHVALLKSQAEVVLERIGVVKLSNVQVIHCGQSYGLCLETSVPCGATTSTTSTTAVAMDDDAAASAVSASTTVTTTSTSATRKQGGQEDTHTDLTFKLVYSGDTRPCRRLIEAGHGACVLIHEATFDDDKADEAVLKRHSTTGEALEVARKMGAFRLVLTHFSQRYPGVPPLRLGVPKRCTLPQPQPHTQKQQQQQHQHQHQHQFERRTSDNWDGGDDSGALSSCVVSVAAPATATATATATLSPAAPASIPPIMAFDFMRLRMQDLLWAPALTPALAVAFPADTSTTISTAADAEDG